ncbi:MAG TPA: glutamyl-tRNA reductase [Aldersonia sp.]
MTIICVGTNHHVAPIELLERLALAAGDLPPLLERIRARPGIGAVLALSTCNRLEFYLESELPTGEVVRVVTEQLGSPAGLAECVVVWREASAAEHLFSVACGLDSMLVGEQQIVMQIRAAARTAAATMGPELTRLVDAALRTSKRARSETDIERVGGTLVAAGLAAAGLDTAADQLRGCAVLTALIVGAGTVAGTAGLRLRDDGVARILIANRSRANSARLAGAVGGEVVEFGRLRDALAVADLVVAAIRTTRPVLSASDVRGARRHAADRRLFVLDLGMPRNVDPECRHIPGVTVVDLRDLGRRLGDRDVPDGAAKARAIVAESVAAFVAARGESTAAALIAALRSRARDIVEAELVRMQRRLPGVDERVLAETTTTIHRIVGKLLHEPTLRAKQFAVAPDAACHLEALAELYGVGTAEVTATSEVTGLTT